MNLEHWWALSFSERLELERAINHILWVKYRDDPAGIEAFVVHAVDMNRPTSLAIAEIIVDMLDDDDGHLAANTNVDTNSLKALLNEKVI